MKTSNYKTKNVKYFVKASNNEAKTGKYFVKTANDGVKKVKYFVDTSNVEAMTVNMGVFTQLTQFSEQSQIKQFIDPIKTKTYRVYFDNSRMKRM